MEKIQHKMVAVNGINMHVAELGTGPTILFIHGFPELWYTWRHQILYLASHGYRAVAPDLRGYGDTTGAPVSDPTKFTTLHVVGDLVALINIVAASGEDKVFVVGHDWGAMIAWALCLYRPDKVKALVNMSVPFSPRNPKFKPIDGLRALYGNDYYIIRFQVLLILQLILPSATPSPHSTHNHLRHLNHPSPLYMHMNLCFRNPEKSKVNLRNGVHIEY